MKHRSEDQIKLLRTEQEVVFYQELLSPISWEKTTVENTKKKKNDKFTQLDNTGTWKT